MIVYIAKSTIGKSVKMSVNKYQEKVKPLSLMIGTMMMMSLIQKRRLLKM